MKTKFRKRYQETKQAATLARLGEVSIPIGGAFSCKLCDRIKRPKVWRLAYSRGFCSRKCLEFAASLKLLVEAV